MQKTLSESSLAGWSIFVLSVVLVIVYIIFFSLPKKSNVVSLVEGFSVGNEVQKVEKVVTITPVQIGKVLGEESSNDSNGDSKLENNVMYTQTVTPKPRNELKKNNLLPGTPTYIVSSHTLFTTSPKVGEDENLLDNKIAPAQILYLSGTHHWVGVMKSAKFLGFADSVQYILKNNDNTQFAYIGKQLPEMIDSFQALGGKSIAFTEKNDIHTHGLFGDKIIFLLVPQYIGKKQLFFVYFAEAKDRWFIQVDTDIFETTKPLLRELFTKWYNRY